MVCLKVGPKSAHPDYKKSKDRLSLGESTIACDQGRQRAGAVPFAAAAELALSFQVTDLHHPALRQISAPST